MRWPKLLLATIASLTWALGAQAAVIHSTYTFQGSNSWTVQFTVVNNGDPAPIHEFSVYFSESLFTNLSLGTSPASWDSLVIQPDTALPASGYLDALVLDSADALAGGQSQAGFSLNFDYLGAGSPGPLAFDVFSEGFVLMSSGTTRLRDAGGTVPEPPSLALVAFAALASLAIAGRRAAPSI